jgi:hypothetical protein
MNFYKNEPQDDENLFEDWLKSCQASPNKENTLRTVQTVEINSAAQSYQEMFKNVEILSVSESKDSFKMFEYSSKPSSPGASFVSPKEKSVSLLGIRDLNRTCYDSVVEQPQESDEVTKVFCFDCKKSSFPKISLQVRDLGVWDNFKYFLKSFKCCSAVNELKDFHEYTYICPYCHKILLCKPAIPK